MKKRTSELIKKTMYILAAIVLIGAMILPAIVLLFTGL